jgi:hypothetical protein
MLIKIEATGDYVQTNARRAVMRVQKDDQKTMVRVVTLDGGHLTIPVPPGTDGSIDAGVVQALCDEIAMSINVGCP